MKKLLIIPFFIFSLLILSSIGQCSYGDIVGKISEYRWGGGISDYATKPDSIRIGTSNYYLIVSAFNTGAIIQTVARTIHVYPNNGTIKQSDISSYIIDTSSNPDYHKVLYISGNIYACSFYKGIVGRIVSFYVWSNNGTIRGINNTKELTNNGEYVDFTRINKTNTFIVTYSKVGVLGKRSLQYDKITINNDGSFGATVTNKVINGNQGLYPRVISLNGSHNISVFAYYRNSTTDSKVMLETWNISSGTRIDRWEVDSQGYYPVVRYMKGTIYIIAFQDHDGYGYVYSFDISKTGRITKGFIEGGSYTSLKKGGRFPTFFKANVVQNEGTGWNNIGITYVGNNSKGNVTVVKISDIGGISAVLTPFTYNTTNSNYLCPVQYVNKSFYLFTYESSNHGISCTINITTDLRTWKTIDNSFNGLIRNNRFKLLNYSYNGQFKSISKWKLIDNSYNGQFKNLAKWKLIDNSYNGQFKNLVKWNLINNSYNGSFKSIALWKLIENSFNGTIRNISINITGYLIISNEKPLNNSIINYYFDNSTFYLSFDINKSVILWYNVSVYFDNILVHISNHTLNNSFYFDIYSNYSHELYYDTIYIWNISVKDNTGNYTNKTYNFNTGTNIYASSLSFDNQQFFLIILFGVWLLIVFKYIDNRKQEVSGILAYFQLAMCFPTSLYIFTLSYLQSQTFGYIIGFLIPIVSIYLIADHIYNKKQKK